MKLKWFYCNKYVDQTCIIQVFASILQSISQHTYFTISPETNNPRGGGGGWDSHTWGVLGMCRWAGCLFELPALVEEENEENKFI